MHEQEEEKEGHDSTEPVAQEPKTDAPEENKDTTTEDQEEKHKEDEQTRIPRSNYGIYVDAIHKHLGKEPETYETELYADQNMELMKQDDIEGALTEHHKDLQGTDNGAKRNEETTRTNWGTTQT